MILVTGATGFLGSELCKQLVDKGNALKSLKRSSSTIPPSLIRLTEIEWIEGSLLSEADVLKLTEKITIIYHCAATVSFNPDTDHEMMRFNVEGTKNLVKVCLQKNIPLVHVSSVATLEGMADGTTTELDFPNSIPITHPYGQSKYLAEVAVWEGINSGLQAIIVNPSIILGYIPNYGGSSSLFKIVKSGLWFYTQGGAGFVAVEDVAKCMIELVQQSAFNERYIISAENLSYKYLFEKIAQSFNVKPPKLIANKLMLEIGWRAAKILSLFTKKPTSFTKHTARSSLNTSKYTNEKVTLKTGIKFQKIDKYIEIIAAKYANE